MSAEAPLTPDPDVAMLARLAALDMASVEHVHARLMAATDAGEINDLGRTQERFARSLRRTLALKARLAQEAARRAERRAIEERRRPPPRDPHRMAVIDRVADLQDALARVGQADGLRGERAFERLNERLDAEVQDWTEHEDFTDGDLDAQVRWICGRLGLPPHLAEAWRDLPHPDEAEPPWGWPDEADDPEDSAEAGAETAPTEPDARPPALPAWPEPPPYESSA